VSRPPVPAPSHLYLRPTPSWQAGWLWLAATAAAAAAAAAADLHAPAAHRDVTSNLVAQPLGGDDGHLLAHALVGLEVDRQAHVVLLYDDAGGPLGRLGADASLRAGSGDTARQRIPQRQLAAASPCSIPGSAVCAAGCRCPGHPALGPPASAPRMASPTPHGLVHPHASTRRTGWGCVGRLARDGAGKGRRGRRGRQRTITGSGGSACWYHRLSHQPLLSHSIQARDDYWLAELKNNLLKIRIPLDPWNRRTRNLGGPLPKF
jgi:hypothetical protein